MKKEIQIYILELLKLFKEKFSDGKSNPSFQIGEDGRLWLWLPIGEIYQSIIFDEENEDMTTKEIFDDVIDSLLKAGYKI